MRPPRRGPATPRLAAGAARALLAAAVVAAPTFAPAVGAAADPTPSPTTSSSGPSPTTAPPSGAPSTTVPSSATRSTTAPGPSAPPATAPPPTTPSSGATVGASTPPSAPLLPVRVQLTRLRPLAPQPGQTLTLRGTLHNVSATTVQGLQVHLELSRSRVGSRSEFDGYADTPDGPAPLDAVELPTASVDLADQELPRDGSEPFTVTVPVDDLHLPAPWQVYELAVSVTGLDPTGTATLGRLRTFLPWAPVAAPGTGVPIQLAWVWPLVDRPHRAGAGTWTDDTLAAALAPTGRLGGLLHAGVAAATQQPPPPPSPRHRRHKRHQQKPPPPRPTIRPVPVTWAVDPLLVQDAGLMADGYRVGTGTDAHPGAGAAAARAWLTAVRQAVTGGTVLALPYADPDVTAATGAGLADVVQGARVAGQRLLHDALGIEPLTYAWPPDGLIDKRALDAAFTAGVSTVVLDSAALPYPGGIAPNETPGAKTTVPTRDGSLTALVADHTLSTVADTGAATPAEGPLATQRLLSELLMIQAEGPSDRRALVIAPDRRWAPTSSYATALLTATGRVPWVEPVSLSAVAAAPASDTAEPRPLAYPALERARQLSRGYLDSVRALTHRIDAVADILPYADPQARAYDAALRRLLSSAWRAAPREARQDREVLEREVTHTLGQVRIDSKNRSLVTLTSHSGIVPVTVSNDLDTPVRVRVGIDPSPQLVVKGSQVTRTIPPHRRVPVDVHASAKVSGVFSLNVALYTPKGQRFGPVRTLTVRSTAYGTTALLVTGGATAVLFVTVAIRLGRRAVAARRAARAAG